MVFKKGKRKIEYEGEISYRYGSSRYTASYKKSFERIL